MRAVLEHTQIGGNHLRVVFLGHFQFFKLQRVLPQRDRFARHDILLQLGLKKGGTDNADDGENDADMYDITAVTPPIFIHQLHRRDDGIFAVHTHPRANPAIKFQQHGPQNERRRGERDQAIRVAHAQRHKKNRCDNRNQQRRHEIAFEMRGRRAPPTDERANAHQYNQRQKDGPVNLIEKRRGDGDLFPHKNFAQHRKDGAPQCGDRRAEQNQIVQQERGFARYERIETVFFFELVHAEIHQVRKDHQDRRDVREEQGTHRTHAERVHRLNHAAARNERTQNTQQEREHDEDEIPHF
ncbi:MAG: hypothetical protein HDKAJFGB_02585 [Anaerolineae bacterium]|nr:hypothetical protein [Anaerolineae bacterium]